MFKTTENADFLELEEQIKSLLIDEKNFIANASNFLALLYNSIANINWIGLYFLEQSELVLAMFQGKPACNRIAIGKGVCGYSFQTQATIIVDNVEEFSGHIACDTNSKSEIVIPIILNNLPIGVLDIDSPIYNRFDNEFKYFIEKSVNILIESSDINKFMKFYEF